MRRRASLPTRPHRGLVVRSLHFGLGPRVRVVRSSAVVALDAQNTRTKPASIDSPLVSPEHGTGLGSSAAESTESPHDGGPGAALAPASSMLSLRADPVSSPTDMHISPLRSPVSPSRTSPTRGSASFRRILPDSLVSMTPGSVAAVSGSSPSPSGPSPSPMLRRADQPRQAVPGSTDSNGSPIAFPARPAVVDRSLIIDTRSRALPAAPSTSDGADLMSAVATAAPAATTQQQTGTASPEKVLTPYGDAWDHRFVSKFLEPLGAFCTNLRSLSLSGCHVFDHALEELLPRLPHLERLDISYTTVKRQGLAAIARSCRTRLEWLDISGIFRLGRNRGEVLLEIAACCHGLRTVVALDCPELQSETLSECLQLRAGMRFLRDAEAEVG
nr:hypothetical protein HK105_003970 [Polyrhizophydium stewartii]